MSLSEFYGPVKACGQCTNPGTPMPCHNCLGHGFVAVCMQCDGKGHVTVKMAGGPGEMKSTCNPCAGRGVFPVRKPEKLEGTAEPKKDLVTA